jgi:flavin reductase (DIM6/NTAB) family NADH-FMN oxidoreductase RutF
MNETNNEPMGAALGKVASGIVILTARRGDQETGMLASWVQQASFEPPMITVAVKNGRYLADWIRATGVLAINILGDGQKSFLAHFGKGFAPDEPAFDGMQVERRATGVPILSDSLGFLDCRCAGTIEAGDHTVFLAEVVDGGLHGDDEQPMVHVRRSGFKY